MYEFYKKGDYRQIITIKAPKGISRNKFKEWFFRRAEGIKNLDKLKWYTLNFTLDNSPFGPPKFDVIEEMWFSALDDLKAAYESKIMQEGIKEIKNKGFYKSELFQAAWLEEYIVKMKGYNSIPKKKGMVKLTGICKQPSTRQALVDWFYQHALRGIDKDGYLILPRERWYTHCFSINSPFGLNKINGCAENWWDSLEEMEKDFKSDFMKMQLKDREDNIDIINPSYFQGFWSNEFIIKIPK